jgi:hypothetical protein
MAQIPYSGFVVQPFRGSSASLQPLGFTGAAVLLVRSAPALPTKRRF